MTLIAGIFSRSQTHQLPPSACEALKRSISRHPNEEVSVFQDQRSYFVKVDIGAYKEQAAYCAPDGALSLLAGEPLLNLGNDGLWQSRERDLASIHDSSLRGDWNVLAQAQGVFCAIHYQPATATLSLISDKLGLRPLYYWVNEKYVVFASALRLLEGLAEVPKKMDIRAVTEIVGLTFPLSRRTPYADISVLKAAEIVQINESDISQRHYWRWDAIEPSGDSEQVLLGEAHRRFEKSVARRIRDDHVTVSFLSGGLDSRCVVATLRSQNVRVHTYNFARPQTQDQIFGNDFAGQIGSLHEAIPKEPGDHLPDYSSLLSRVWTAAQLDLEQPAERPSVVWSGEGGSVALGHVHLNEKIVELMRAGKVDDAIEEFLRSERAYIPPKLFRAEIFSSLSGLIREGIKAELNELHNADPARNFYLFLMLNDQRRKLSGHFENIDLHRLEYQLPFFDSAFLSLIMSVPVELCLGHKFYTKWLGHFHTAVTSVPWQAYPGHEPCPLPVPEGLAYQWAEENQAAERATQKRRLMKQATELLRATDFPDPILNKRNLRLATWIHATGWRDYRHIIEAGRIFHTYWKKCGGEYALASR